MSASGRVAQLGERIPRTDEVEGSTPFPSTIMYNGGPQMTAVLFFVCLIIRLFFCFDNYASMLKSEIVAKASCMLWVQQLSLWMVQPACHKSCAIVSAVLIAASLM